MKPTVDMHNHTTLSACCEDKNATAAAYIDKAAELGVQVLGISNHCWDNKMPGASAWYKPQDVEWCLKIHDEMPKDTKGVKVFIGIETEYFGMYDRLGISAENAVKFDYILIPHSHTHMKNHVIPYDPYYLEALGEFKNRLRAAFPEVSDRQIEKWVNAVRPQDLQPTMKGVPIEFVSDFMVQSFQGLLENAELQKFKDKVPTFVAHPFIACGYGRADRSAMVERIPDETFVKLFTLMAQKGLGYDISIGNFDIDHPDTCQMYRLVRLAKSCGVKFLFGTDAHSIAGLSGGVKSAIIYQNAGLTPDDLHPLYRDFVR